MINFEDAYMVHRRNKDPEYDFQDDLYCEENDDICDFNLSTITNPTITLTKDSQFKVTYFFNLVSKEGPITKFHSKVYWLWEDVIA